MYLPRVRLPPLRIADQQAHTCLLKLREDVRLVNQVRPRLVSTALVRPAKSPLVAQRYRGSPRQV